MPCIFGFCGSDTHTSKKLKPTTDQPLCLRLSLAQC